MALSATERYADAASLVADLRAWLEDRAVSACPDGPAARLARWMRHHRVAAALLAGTLASAVAGGVVLLALLSSHNVERARLAEAAQGSAERASSLERSGRERLERRAAAFREYLPGLDLLQRAEYNQVWAARALAAFDRAIAADPECAEAHRARARALSLGGQPRDALPAYQRALELSHAALGRDDPELLRSIGDLLWMKLDDIPGAKEWFRRAAEADPLNPHARVAKAVVRSLEGEHVGAIDEMRALATEAPDWWEVQQCLGMLLLGASPRGVMDLRGGPKGISDPKAAAAALTEAIRLRPGHATLHVHRGMARTMQYFGGDQRRELLDGCLADYDLAVNLAPDWLNAHTLRLQANYFDKHPAVVEQERAILRQRWPKDPVALQARALVEVSAGQSKALLADVEAALAESPESAALKRLRDGLKSRLAGGAAPVAPATPATPQF